MPATGSTAAACLLVLAFAAPAAAQTAVPDDPGLDQYIPSLPVPEGKSEPPPPPTPSPAQPVPEPGSRSRDEWLLESLAPPPGGGPGDGGGQPDRGSSALVRPDGSAPANPEGRGGRRERRSPTLGDRADPDGPAAPGALARSVSDGGSVTAVTLAIMAAMAVAAGGLALIRPGRVRRRA